MAVHTDVPHKHIPRGDASMRKSGKSKDYGVLNVVKTMQIGNTTIEFCDNAIPKDPVRHQENVDEFIRVHKMIQIQNARRAANKEAGAI